MKTKNANNDVLDGIRTVATLFSQGKLYISKVYKSNTRITYIVGIQKTTARYR